MSILDINSAQKPQATQPGKPHTAEIPPQCFGTGLSPDAGARAAERMRERNAAMTIKRFVRRLMLGFSLLLILSLGGLGYYAHATKVTGYVTDTRSCSLEIDGKELTGTREYSYPFTEILGFRLIDTKHIEETTKVDIRGESLRVVGLNNTEWWTVKVGVGEKGIQQLKPAHTYTFVLGDKVGVVPYRAFCK